MIQYDSKKVRSWPQARLRGAFSLINYLWRGLWLASKECRLLANLTAEHMHFAVVWHFPDADNYHSGAALLANSGRVCFTDLDHTRIMRLATMPVE